MTEGAAAALVPDRNDVAWDAGDVAHPVRADAAPRLNLDGFEGPLDFLLEMVRRHRVDLGRLSLVGIADQFVAAFEAARHRVTLERRGDWVVMAATLLMLKAQLLWPSSPEAAAEAAAEADRRLRALTDLAEVRAAAAWLDHRPHLGIDLFPRGRPERAPHPQAAWYVAFLEATLVMLEGRYLDAADGPPLYRPELPDLWRIADAIARVRALLAAGPLPLLFFLPERIAGGAHAALARRAAVASTFVAGLELAKEGALAAEQHDNFGPIMYRAA